MVFTVNTKIYEQMQRVSSSCFTGIKIRNFNIFNDSEQKSRCFICCSILFFLRKFVDSLRFNDRYRTCWKKYNEEKMQM